MLVVQKSIPAFRKYTVKHVGIKECNQKKISVMTTDIERSDEACNLIIEESG